MQDFCYVVAVVELSQRSSGEVHVARIGRRGAGRLEEEGKRAHGGRGCVRKRFRLLLLVLLLLVLLLLVVLLVALDDPLPRTCRSREQDAIGRSGPGGKGPGTPDGPQMWCRWDGMTASVTVRRDLSASGSDDPCPRAVSDAAS